jgi:hypothetical protein
MISYAFIGSWILSNINRAQVPDLQQLIAKELEEESRNCRVRERCRNATWHRLMPFLERSCSIGRSRLMMVHGHLIFGSGVLQSKSRLIRFFSRQNWNTWDCHQEIGADWKSVERCNFMALMDAGHEQGKWSLLVRFVLEIPRPDNLNSDWLTIWVPCQPWEGTSTSLSCPWSYHWQRRKSTGTETTRKDGGQLKDDNFPTWYDLLVPTGFSLSGFSMFSLFERLF